MSVPVFLHFMSDGKVYSSNDINYTPPGTVTGTVRVLDDATSGLLCTLSGTFSSNLVVTTVTGVTGKYAKEKT